MQSDIIIPRLLEYDECLVYIENTRSFADVDGTTQIAKVLRTPIDKDDTGSLIQWYELELVTEADGDKTVSALVNDTNVLNNKSRSQRIIVSEDHILSNISMRDIHPRHFYNFASLINSFDPDGEIQYPLAASNFVIKNKTDKPLQSTSRSALGSGINGIYLTDESIIPSLLTNNTQITYQIICQNPYLVQDKEHGESITVASLHTNRYLDRVIPFIQGDKSIDPLSIIRMNSIQNITTLWNIVFYRTGQFINQDWLENILVNYINRYINDSNLIDGINGDILQELPINDILKGLGYDGIIGDDSYTNSWDRGCVSFNYKEAVFLQGGIARY